MTNQEQKPILGATVHASPFSDALCVIGGNVAVLLGGKVYTFPKPEIDLSRATTTMESRRDDDEIKVRLTMRFL